MSFTPKRWTYDKPTTSDVDAVRFLVGDTDPNDKQLDDCEIEWLLDDNGNVIGAAICAAIALAAIYSRQYDSRGIGSLGTIAQHYLDLSKALIAKRGRKAVAAFAGGISRTDKTTRAADSDRVRPEFTRHMMERNFTHYGLTPPWGCY